MQFDLIDQSKNKYVLIKSIPYLILVVTDDVRRQEKKALVYLEKDNLTSVSI